MANSMFDYNDKGFWVPDVYLEALYLLILSNNNDVSDYFFEILNDKVLGYDSGAIDIDIIDLNSEKKSELINLLDNTKKNLLVNTDMRIEHVDLNNLVSKYSKDSLINFEHDLMKKNILKLIDFLSDLIKQKLEITPNDPVDYWSS